MAKKKTADQLANECDRRLRTGVQAGRQATPRGKCDPGCCDSLVEILEQEREQLLHALCTNISAEVACVDCCQPPPEAA